MWKRLKAFEDKELNDDDRLELVYLRDKKKDLRDKAKDLREKRKSCS